VCHLKTPTVAPFAVVGHGGLELLKLIKILMGCTLLYIAKGIVRRNAVKRDTAFFSNGRPIVGIWASANMHNVDGSLSALS
jgi:hypothetical protein